MKKIVLGACLLGVAMLFATSCKKNNSENTAKLYTTTQELANENGDFEVSDGSKVYFTGNKLYFDEEDQVRLFSIDESTPANSRHARYTPTVGAQVDNNTEWTIYGNDQALPTSGTRYAFCPGDAEHVIVDEKFNDPNPEVGKNRATFVLPTELKYREINGEATLPKEGFYMASKLEVDQSSFMFRNICGVLHLKLYSTSSTTRKVTSIKVTDNFKNVSGKVSLIIPNIDPEEMTWLFNNYNESNPTYMDRLNEYIRTSGYSVSEAKNYVTLVCDTPVELGRTSSTAKSFYIPMRPLALLKGCKIEVFVDGLNEPLLITSSRNNMIKPNTRKNMSPVNVK